jgi:hypothetical protein
MIQTSDYQRINELLSELGDYLNTTGRHGSVQRAYMAAQNSLMAPDRAGEAMQDLASKLRESAAVAEQLAEIFPKP